MFTSFLLYIAEAVVGFFGGYTAMPWWAYQVVNRIYDFLGMPHTL